MDSVFHFSDVAFTDCDRQELFQGQVSPSGTDHLRFVSRMLTDIDRLKAKLK